MCYSPFIVNKDLSVPALCLATLIFYSQQKSEARPKDRLEKCNDLKE